ncbi:MULTISPECIES: ABC transporter ATP-binding protein [unclassified Treponema]|uniref:ABC transporter ATP-binding protein n=1 Tax=unclassified Treponema TaxID=2638727 RepID=UPI0020A54ED6|nr:MULTISPECIES: ABC transporter ATP-binding protein [unclassified Treponema]UTC66515.1 ABC transporter ATP-binding protein [Treponema sp. OMZ 789]UTC69247.1 ABC transporter ATP-binding protein [Treponema sp. OMZ 790]UTC71960.1 ABC transporter ATP-binding protein [Treponema sp. OMZ 791]
MDMLRIENLSLSYGEKHVVQNLNLRVKKGQVVSIIGPNASGKSTILKSIAGIIKPAGGKIFIEEKDISKMDSKRLAQKVSILLQQNRTPDDISVEELVYFGRYPRKKWFEGFESSDKKIIEEVMRLTNTLSLRDKTLEKLSGGERQRAWIAMALAQEPDILLFDEPTTYLDLAHQIEFLELVNRLNRETGVTAVLVLHDLNQAARYGNYLFAMKDGRLFAQGSPQEVLTPQNILSIYKIEADIINRSDRLVVIPR